MYAGSAACQWLRGNPNPKAVSNTVGPWLRYKSLGQLEVMYLMTLVTRWLGVVALYTAQCRVASDTTCMLAVPRTPIVPSPCMYMHMHMHMYHVSICFIT